MKRAKKMRLTSQIWVSAFLRAETVAGAYAAILRKGAAGAGAIFVVHNRLDSTYTVYSPAPQTVFEAGETTERRFEKVADAVGEEEIRAYLDRQVSFDPDCWIVETERRDPPAFLTVV